MVLDKYLHDADLHLIHFIQNQIPMYFVEKMKTI